ncbi:MAG: ATP-dependent DNA ligase [Acidimicrobiales bacterium]
MRFNLPLQPPLAPMLAKALDDLPLAAGMIYEPKWDGFRCVIFRDGDNIELSSRGERPLTRYFPELIEALAAGLPQRCVIDGEIVIVGRNGLDFDALLQRIHPAESRVQRLALETPASFVAFDILAIGDDDLRSTPFGERRSILIDALGQVKPPIHLTPATTDPATAADWFERFEGAGLDGVMAKPASLTYQADRRVMFKVKHQRTADCVVGGFRWHKDSGVGSLLLGLYDDDGVLHHVGVATSFTAKLRLALVDELSPLREDALDGHPWRDWAEATASESPNDSGQRMPGASSRWNAKKDLSWEPLRAERVAEVAYDHLQRDRFRHATRLVRWRDDRTPASCTYAQLEQPVPEELHRVFGTDGLS